MKLRTNDLKNYLAKYKISLVIGMVAVIMLILFFVLGQKPKSAKSNMATAEVIKGNIEVSVTGTGTITPWSEGNIWAEVAGTVKKINVKNGSRVKKGDVLLELTNDELDIELEKTKLDNAKAELSVEESLKKVSQDTLNAPFAGRIVSLEAKKGDEVSQNTSLATLRDDSQLIFDMPVDSKTVNKAQLNQEVEVFLLDKGDTVQGVVLGKSGEGNSGNQAYLKVGIARTGNLAANLEVFGTINIDNKAVDALAVSTLEWKNETQIKSTLNGKLTGVKVEKGQSIKKGQALFELASDTTQNEQKSAQISYQQSKLSTMDVENKLSGLMVKAPIDGVVTEMDVNVGDEIEASSKNQSSSNTNSASSTTSATTVSLGKVINSTAMKVTVPVDEVDIAKVKLEQTVKIAVDALPDKSFTGTVTEIAEEGIVENNVSSFDVTISLDNNDNLLKSGMTANITIIVAEKSDAALIPIEALQEKDNKKFVIIAEGGEGEQKINLQPIEVGLINDTYAEVLSGLKIGDKISLPAQSTAANSQNMMLPGGPPGMGGNRPSGASGGVRIQRGGSNAR